MFKGLFFLHNSAMNFHGFLSSAYCLIDERWQVKISYYGLKLMKKLNNSSEANLTSTKELLWRAPELLRGKSSEISTGYDFSEGSKEGDIYSFAIISSEILNLKPAWEEPLGDNGLPLPQRFRDLEEIIYLVKKGGLIAPRPTIRPVVPDINPALVCKV